MVDTSKLDYTPSSGAVFSEDRVYRYELWRRWGPGDAVLWIMLNPSTADAEKNDPTIRRCIGFTKKWGFNAIVACNIFALRSTDPKKLKEVKDPIGPNNTATIITRAKQARLIVCAWGGHGDLCNQGRHIFEHLCDPNVRNQGAMPLRCLGTTQKGQPKHPLYIPYEQELVSFDRAPAQRPGQR